MTTENTAATTPTTPAPETKPAKPALLKQNGITRPAAAGQTGKVWEIADQISAAQKRPALRKEVMEEGKKQGVNPATIATQYGRWRKFFGLGKEAKPVEQAPAAAATGTAAPAGDVSVETK